VTIKTFGKKILLVHDPVDAYMQIENFDLALTGHVHNIWKFKKYIINVGVDVWDYYPVHMKQILKAHDIWLKTQ
jgi:calcineurin-like phosphoesterase family protein